MHVVPYKCSALVGLSLDMEGIQAFGEGLEVRPISRLELLAEEGLSCPYLFDLRGLYLDWLYY